MRLKQSRSIEKVGIFQFRMGYDIAMSVERPMIYLSKEISTTNLGNSSSKHVSLRRKNSSSVWKNSSSVWKNSKLSHMVKYMAGRNSTSRNSTSRISRANLTQLKSSEGSLKRPLGNSQYSTMRLSMDTTHSKPRKNIKTGRQNMNGTTTRLGITSTLPETLNSVEM